MKALSFFESVECWPDPFAFQDKSGINLANGLYYFIIKANGQRWMTKVLVLK